MKPTGDLTKLPKWAQSYVTHLERELVNAEERVIHLMTKCDPRESGPGMYWSFIDRSSGGRYSYTKLPEREAIFVLKNRHSVSVSLRGEGDELNVNSHDGSVLVQPNAANSINVLSVRR